jgi:uncharacterized repeat protein (TIGR01451 family)
MNMRSLKRIVRRYSFFFCLWLGSLALYLCLMNGTAYGQARTFEVRNRASGSYGTLGATPGVVTPVQASSPLNSINGDRLVDPLGQIVDCGGNEFADYTGFTVGLYAAIGNGGEIGAPIALSPTNPPNTIPPLGIAPNISNVNPYSISNTAINGRRGVYNFLLNNSQLTTGSTYILVVNPPANLALGQRRIRIVLGTLNGIILPYTATSVDGRPIGVDGAFSITESVTVNNAAQNVLSLVALQLNAFLSVCESREIQIIKTGDRAAAEPGDIASYRLTIKNLTSTTLINLVIADSLPVGLRYIQNSARAAVNGNPVPVTVKENGINLSFALQAQIPPGNVNALIAYAVTVSPDAVRGTGRNSASASAVRADNNYTVRDGPAIFTMRIRPGIVSDCATLIGRVFVDKNFDGEQQNGEPGIPNAVVFMDDGNRIVTDANGLYSVANVIPGARTLVLDLSSLPGYTLAPNLYFIERNSQSRLVRLSPGSLGRANFAVTPAFKGVGGQQ